MKVALIISTKDTASMNIKNKLLDHDFNESGIIDNEK